MGIKYTLKTILKNKELHFYLLKNEGVRIQGDAFLKIPKDDMTLGHSKTYIEDIYLKFDKEFEIGFKKNDRANIKQWIKTNVIKCLIDSKLQKNIQEEIIKTLDYGTIIMYL